MEALLLLAIIVGFYFALRTKKSVEKFDEKLEAQNPTTINVPKSEKDRILEEANRIIEKAKKMKIPELVWAVFVELKKYPYFIKNLSPDRISEITSVEEIKPDIAEKILKKLEIETHKNPSILKVIALEQEYFFAFGSSYCSFPDGDGATFGELYLIIDGKKVCGIDLIQDINEYSSNWKITKLEAFIEGTWVKKMELIRRKIEEQNEIKKEKYKLDEEKKLIEKLKKNFSIKQINKKTAPFRERFFVVEPITETSRLHPSASVGPG